MKCIILAGGAGDRLWPLSRKNYPKQFIQIQGDHSLFQETIARNIPYCDEFIIVTNREYRFIAENQISAFQGLVHRYIFEGEGRKTTAAITLACMQLPLSEVVLVVPADQIVGEGAYKDDLMHAKELCGEGQLVTFGMPIEAPEDRFGYIRYAGEDVLQFTEKPDKELARTYMTAGDYLVNSGMFVFCVGNYLHELEMHSPEVYQACKQAYRMRQVEPDSYTFAPEVMRSIPAVPVERAVFEKTKNAKVVHASFDWKDIGSLEDLKSTELRTAMDGQQVQYECANTDIINHCPRRVVVANELEDMVIVNTKDAVYVGKKGASGNLKTILEENTQIAGHVEGGRVRYRQWGNYELLVDEPTYRVKKVVIQCGKTIYAHKHLYRSEHWSVVSGEALIELEGVSGTYYTNDVIDVNRDVVHQVSNVGNEPLVIIEVAVGENVTEDDKITDCRPDLTEEQLGMQTEPFVKLRPAFKDYLWGGTRLKELYGKKCDYDIVAESWELSAHEAGQSIVAAGRHKGMSFGEYLNIIGKNYWGWKCRPLDAFPILIKFIDAKGSLSVQVHPDDDYALTVENEYGKNEMWYIIDCEPDSYLYCGFNRDVTREEVARRLADNTILEILNKVPVQKGEAYFIPAGTVHAIGAGLLICEIQQSSNCTYRLYDYCRKDKFGNLRELHIDKALDVLRYDRYEPQKLEDTVEQGATYVKRVISRCKYFECMQYQLDGTMELVGVEESFTSLVCISGSGSIRAGRDSSQVMDFKAGESIFMPKSNEISVIEGQCELIITRI
ncbi:MAG: NTP transferase domain-containing protein [Lachnospiraceae bacterium]|nr:NTP transferase domain-containing protein [Lachnospiraceae bacterium]